MLLVRKSMTYVSPITVNAHTDTVNVYYYKLPTNQKDRKAFINKNGLTTDEKQLGYDISSFIHSSIPVTAKSKSEVLVMRTRGCALSNMLFGIFFLCFLCFQF